MKARIYSTGEYNNDGMEIYDIEEWRGRGGVEISRREFNRIQSQVKTYLKTQSKLKILHDLVKRKRSKRSPRFTRTQKQINEFMNKDLKRMEKKTIYMLECRSPWMDLLKS